MSGTAVAIGTKASEVVAAGYLTLASTAITTTAGYVDVDFVDRGGTALTSDIIPCAKFISLHVDVDPGTTQTTLVKILMVAYPTGPEVELLAETTVASNTITNVYSGVVRGYGIVVQVKQGDGAVTDAAVYITLK